MWGRALVTVQRIEPAAWVRLDLVSRWLIIARASVLVITFISVAIAGLLAIRAGRFDPLDADERTAPHANVHHDLESTGLTWTRRT